MLIKKTVKYQQKNKKNVENQLSYKQVKKSCG